MPEVIYFSNVGSLQEPTKYHILCASEIISQAREHLLYYITHRAPRVFWVQSSHIVIF